MSVISTTLMVAIVTSITLFILLSNQGKDLRATTQELEKMENVKTAYEGYWTGEQKKAVDQLQGMETLTESERQTLLHFLVELKKYDQALQYVGKENTSSLAEQVMKVHGLEELISFQEAYPSPLGEFKIAFHHGEYKQAVDIQDMAMSPELYKQKGIAYLRLDQLEDAKKMASEAKDDELNKKINEYQEIEEQLTKINSQIETEKKSEDQNQSKIDSLKNNKMIWRVKRTIYKRVIHLKSVIAKKQVLILLSICFFISTMLVSTFVWNLGYAMWSTLKTFPEFSKPIEIKASFLTDFHMQEQPLYYGIAALIGFSRYSQHDLQT